MTGVKAVGKRGAQSTAQPPSRPASLTTAALDFWLLGGLSVALLGVWYVASFFPNTSTIPLYKRNAAGFFTVMMLFVNFPHLMTSYKLAYSLGSKFVRTHWLQMLLVPTALLGLMTTAYFSLDMTRPSAGWPALEALNDQLRAIGLQPVLGSSISLGGEILLFLRLIMITTLGWHLAKQAYGCMMMYARFDGYSLTHVQRGLIRWALLAAWLTQLAWQQSARDATPYYGLNEQRLGLPATAWHIAAGVTVVLVALCAWAVIYQNARRGQRPSATFLVPFVAYFVWWFPSFQQPEITFVVANFAHSLQYLTFIYKAEKKPRSHGRAVAFVIGMVLVGWTVMELIPNSLDEALGMHQQYNVWFFLICSGLLFNVHHYFIDNVLWRSTNRPIYDRLSATT